MESTEVRDPGTGSPLRVHLSEGHSPNNPGGPGKPSKTRTMRRGRAWTMGTLAAKREGRLTVGNAETCLALACNLRLAGCSAAAGVRLGRREVSKEGTRKGGRRGSVDRRSGRRDGRRQHGRTQHRGPG